MLTPRACDRLTVEDKPRISIDALHDLRRLISAQSPNNSLKTPGHAESPAGGQDGKRPKSSRVATAAALRGRADVGRTSGIRTGALSDALAPAAGKRSQNRRTEAK